MTTAGELKIDLGVLLHEPEGVYHGKKGKFLTSHLLGDFRRCPLLFIRRKLGILPDEDRPAYMLGRAAHVRILEGRDKYNASFAVGGPINPQTGKPFGPASKAFADWAVAQKKPVLSVEQAQLVESMAIGVAMNSAAVDLIVDGVAEGVLRADYCGVPCQIRMDWLNPYRGITDLKTCDDLTWFEADARRFAYAHQVAFYRSILGVVTGERVPAHLVAIEKKEPFRCGVWRVSDDSLDACACENAAAIERLKSCERSGVWPTGYEEPRVLDVI